MKSDTFFMIIILACTVAVVFLIIKDSRRKMLEYSRGFDAGIKYQQRENYRHGVMTKKYKWLDKYKLAR